MKSINVCRCCLSESCYKDISNEYYHAGQKEIYSDILLETFNLKVSHIEGVKRLICDGCITKLRSAADFKKQVLSVEHALIQKLLEIDKDVPAVTSPKQEINKYDQDDYFDDSISDDVKDDDFKWQIDDNAFNDDQKGQIFVIKLKPKVEKKPQLNMKGKIQKYKANTTVKKTTVAKKINQTKAKPSERKRKRKPTSETQLALRENTLKLILNSNMCLFESLKTKYRCFTCIETYMTIQELREHSKTHSNPSDIAHKVNRLQGMSFKNVDISSLACKLCSDSCTDLTDLKKHLIEKHDFVFGDAEHLLIPFKLENDFKCVICGENFHTFVRLVVHMNIHSTNNVCEICGVSYINRLSLRMHVHSMHKEKKCSLCSVTFTTNYSRVKHMRDCHNVYKSKRYCLLCDKTFLYTYELTEHKIQEHGAKRPISKCTECGKTFLTPQNLRIHIRSVHVRERNYPCILCGMRFFTKTDQKRHEKTHDTVRSFSCSYCESTFKSKDSVRRHLKKQHESSF